MSTNIEQNEREEAENALYQRFSREERVPEPVVYEFTRDPALLYQYYHLREIMYRKTYHCDKFPGQEDVYDKASHILIARRGNLCVGGCRITVREVDEDFPLPMEEPEFRLKSVLSKEQFEYRHCEVSRFAILSDRYEQEIMQEMLRHVFEKLIQLNVKYLYLKATYPMYRNWRKIANYLGYFGHHLHHGVEAPPYPLFPEVKMVLAHVEMPLADGGREAARRAAKLVTTIQ